MEFSVSVVMDTRLVSLQDKVSVTQESQSSSSSPRSSCDVTRSVTSLETLVRNLTRSQRHSGRTLRHEAGTMDRVQHTVDQIYSHLVSRHRDKIISDSPRFDYLRWELSRDYLNFPRLNIKSTQHFILRSEPQSPGGILTIGTDEKIINLPSKIAIWVNDNLKSLWNGKLELFSLIVRTPASLWAGGAWRWRVHNSRGQITGFVQENCNAFQKSQQGKGYCKIIE